MPVKLSVGLSRKVGEPHFGSRGATVGLEVAVDVELIRDPQRLQQHLAYLFRLARQSVDLELRDRRGPDTNPGNNVQRPACPTTTRPATPRQTRAIRAIASRFELDLPAQLRDRFGVARPDELSLSQASELIDAWNAPRNGRGGGDDCRLSLTTKSAP